ncbi:mediator of RNA polymerase II transcription subunit 8 [Friedmanniomyces endolithicus]|nr:mediator of RNA polymerase II transcription subunit 8 [Friedmanniomyces endolithicus]
MALDKGQVARSINYGANLPLLRSNSEALERTSTLEKHRESLTSPLAYPLPSFPGHTHEALSQNLLRKKLDVALEDWVVQHSKPRPKHNADGTLGIRGSDDRPEDVDYQELWSSVKKESVPYARTFARDGAFRDAYTIAEREAGFTTVTTGLKRDVRKLPKDGKPQRQFPLFDLLGFKTETQDVEHGGEDEDDEDDDEGDDDEDEEDKGNEDAQMEDVMPERSDREPPEPGVDTSLPPLPIETMMRFVATGTLAEQR